MLRAMVFIDYLNFQRALTTYYGTMSLPPPRLDYNRLPEIACAEVTNSVLVKTFLCAPKPDDFLMQDMALANQYRWLNGLKNQKNFDVIEGEFVARSTVEGELIDFKNPRSYYKKEKGTDINIAVEAITKAFNNAYDVGVFMSADTDYIPIYRTLRTIGKLVVVVRVQGQIISKLIPCTDNNITLDKAKFDTILRP